MRIVLYEFSTGEYTQSSAVVKCIGQSPEYSIISLRYFVLFRSP